MKKPKWTQDEAIAFECARECITHMMAICSEAIADDETRGKPDNNRLSTLEARLSELAKERAELTITDQDRIAVIRTEYGGHVRAHISQRTNA